ncbi:helix-turn-helix domain-containing protein [Demetria terragena]|uniref:helix-turn-helix domain-containing protein n=1 Tax=Demetria terragena TaxID=63959 RepID=UPI0012EAE6B1|nr:helix-turn-helix domain-containing protein [Demetria terragena]
MSEFGAPERARIIEEFVGRLLKLREEAGSPSFRAMSKRSGAISHATMHDAVQGTRLPSWETTVEFAKACGVEPETLRAEWERANTALLRSGAEESAGGSASAQAAPAPTPRKDHYSGGPSKSAVMFGVAGLVVGIVVGFFVLKIMNGSDANPGAAATTPAAASTPAAAASKPTAARSAILSTGTGSCEKNPPPHPSPSTDPRYKIKLMTDVTLGDCKPAPMGKKLTKAWTFKNVGSQPLKGLKMKRLGPYRGPTLDCKTPEETPVKTIEPGEIVRVNMPFETATERVDCFVRFMFIKPDGTYAFDYQQPIFVSVHVK